MVALTPSFSVDDQTSLQKSLQVKPQISLWIVNLIIWISLAQR